MVHLPADGGTPGSVPGPWKHNSYCHYSRMGLWSGPMMGTGYKSWNVLSFDNPPFYTALVCIKHVLNMSLYSAPFNSFLSYSSVLSYQDITWKSVWKCNSLKIMSLWGTPLLILSHPPGPSSSAPGPLFMGMSVHLDQTRPDHMYKRVCKHTLFLFPLSIGRWDWIFFKSNISGQNIKGNKQKKWQTIEVNGHVQYFL